MLYFQTIVSPQHFILSKLLFNSLLMLVMSGLSLLLFSLFLGNPLEKILPFVGLVFLGGWSLSLVFSFLAAIAAKAQQNAAIMAILGFPIIIPQLIMLIKISSAAFSQLGVFPLTPVLMLFVLDVLVILLANILFTFLWKD
ncbi:MAG: cytochrome C biogenesis protein, partial [Bacteroidota bacterium]|nr:cytochrome C biogenesis protein [Bacteroidota bacterium]